MQHTIRPTEAATSDAWNNHSETLRLQTLEKERLEDQFVSFGPH